MRSSTLADARLGTQGALPLAGVGNIPLPLGKGALRPHFVVPPQAFSRAVAPR